MVARMQTDSSEEPYIKMSEGSRGMTSLGPAGQVKDDSDREVKIYVPPRSHFDQDNKYERKETNSISNTVSTPNSTSHPMVRAQETSIPPTPRSSPTIEPGQFDNRNYNRNDNRNDNRNEDKKTQGIRGNHSIDSININDSRMEVKYNIDDEHFGSLPTFSTQPGRTPPLLNLQLSSPHMSTPESTTDSMQTMQSTSSPISNDDILINHPYVPKKKLKFGINSTINPTINNENIIASPLLSDNVSDSDDDTRAKSCSYCAWRILKNCLETGTSILLLLTLNVLNLGKPEISDKVVMDDDEIVTLVPQNPSDGYNISFLIIGILTIVSLLFTSRNRRGYKFWCGAMSSSVGIMMIVFIFLSGFAFIYCPFRDDRSIPIFRFLYEILMPMTLFIALLAVDTWQEREMCSYNIIIVIVAMTTTFLALFSQWGTMYGMITNKMAAGVKETLIRWPAMSVSLVLYLVLVCHFSKSPSILIRRCFKEFQAS